MPVTKWGLVYYADDPTQTAFRIVYPRFDDSELNNPYWTAMGVDPTRVAAMRTVPVGGVSATDMLATPGSSAASALSMFALAQPAVVAAVNAAPTALAALAIQNAVKAAATTAAARPGATRQTIAAAAVGAA